MYAQLKFLAFRKSSQPSAACPEPAGRRGGRAGNPKSAHGNSWMRATRAAGTLSRMTRTGWLWLTVAVALVALALATHTAAAQTERATALIERALALQGDVANGKALYQSLCASCHGPQAHGNPSTVTPSLAGQLPVYLIKQVVDFAEGDRTAPEMHRVVALKQLVSPQAIRDLATYLAGLPVNPQPEVGDGKALAAGKRYYDGLCAYCHGASAAGNEQHATPALRGQHFSYLLMQTRGLAVGHRYSVPVEVIQVLEELPIEQITAIADHVARLPAKDPPPL
jgi:cytochrome c553